MKYNRRDQALWVAVGLVMLTAWLGFAVADVVILDPWDATPIPEPVRVIRELPPRTLATPYPVFAPVLDPVESPMVFISCNPYGLLSDTGCAEICHMNYGCSPIWPRRGYL